MSDSVNDTLNDESRPLLPTAHDSSDNANHVHYLRAGPHDNELQSSSASNADTKPEWRAVMAIASSWIGVVLASMDSSIMATLTGPISDSFDSFQLMSWFVNAYLVAAATVQPLSGKLSDIYGRRSGLLLSNLLFLIGNSICGVAVQDWHFIVGRIISGLGAGALHSISTFLISDFIPLRSRGFWQGVSNIAYGAGFAIGGYFGGAINDHFGWRWAFLSQPPLIVMSIILVYSLLPANISTEIPSVRRVDFLGSIMLSLAVIFLLFGAISGGNVLPWSSPLVYGSLITSPLLFATFVYVEENMAREPIIPVKLLKNRSILGACLTYWFDMMGYQTIIYYVPLALEMSGLSPAQSGLRLMPNSIGVFVGSIGSGAMMNATGKYYLLALAGQLGMVSAGALTLGLLSSSAFSWPPFIFMLLNGIGLGISITVLLVAIISAAEHKHHAPLTSASYAFRSTGQVLGITIGGAIFQNLLNRQLWSRLGDEPDAQRLIDTIRKRIGSVRDLPPRWRSDVADSYAAAFNGVWVFILIVFILGTFATAAIRENRLHRTLDRK